MTKHGSISDAPFDWLKTISCLFLFSLFTGYKTFFFEVITFWSSVSLLIDP